MLADPLKDKNTACFTLREIRGDHEISVNTGKSSKSQTIWPTKGELQFVGQLGFPSEPGTDSLNGTWPFLSAKSKSQPLSPRLCRVGFKPQRWPHRIVYRRWGKPQAIKQACAADKFLPQQSVLKFKQKQKQLHQWSLSHPPSASLSNVIWR